jgi:methylaspartate mutase epsilon subunit
VLCPPSLLVALNILEGLFFTAHGVRSISLSYAQQTNFTQDVAAVWALQRLADRWLPDVDRHIVIYTYMGVYPRTIAGARALLEQSARLARTTGAGRLVVKTTAEAQRIPTVEDNVAALEAAAVTPPDHLPHDPGGDVDGEAEEIHNEARTLIEAVLELRPSISAAIGEAFRRGLLDVPFCLHPDNANRTRTQIDDTGRLRWADIGSMPITPVGQTGRVRAHQLLSMLSYMRRRFDAARSVSASPSTGPQ